MKRKARKLLVSSVDDKPEVSSQSREEVKHKPAVPKVDKKPEVVKGKCKYPDCKKDASWSPDYCTGDHHRGHHEIARAEYLTPDPTTYTKGIHVDTTLETA